MRICEHALNPQRCLIREFRALCATDEDAHVPSPDLLAVVHRGSVRVPETATNVATVAVAPAHHAARTAAGRQLQ
jgi:hypothetical protein